MRSGLAALALSAAAVVQASFASAAPTQIDAWASNSLRIRLAAPGNLATVEPPISGLLPSPPTSGTPFSTETSQDFPLLRTTTNGNLQATQDPATGLLTLTRVSDGAVLLRQTGLVFGPAPNGTKVGSASALLSFAGVGADEAIYGFGEQQDGQVAKQLPFFRSVEASEYYPYNHGSQALIGWLLSSKGYAILWNSPAYGYFNVSTDSVDFFANATGCVDFWVTTTPGGFDPSQGVSPLAPLLSQHADAVGHAPAMPYFATGYIQSKVSAEEERGVGVLQLSLARARRAPTHLHTLTPLHASLPPLPPPSSSPPSRTATAIKRSSSLWRASTSRAPSLSA
jgi:alpha-D-xyloside xylohydrolase